ncbi:Epithelial discoidin domain-containing receptor 1 [Ilyodon furcidens]|uniref:Epithelial discoidin domain-containing receptor 1 n=1 Tax=Ilyodon furcidens TaxID=33524 RepID=A0ABV0VJL2_9TELE
MVRFYPLADRVMSVCLRVELYGCVWNDGLNAYTAPVGHVMNLSGIPVYLNDSTYDGSTEQGMQFGGLGQLCDGVLGGDDFIETKELRVWPGYDYLGWSREALGQGSMDIEFHFEKPRLFNNMQGTVALQQECPGFNFRLGVFLHGVCIFSLCMRGFSPGTPASSHSPKT